MPVLASAQQPMLSPPERPPVPLSDGDQLRAAAQARSKPSPEGSTFWPTAGGVGGWLGSALSSGDPTIDALIREAAARNGVDPRLVFLVMQAESGFRFRAVSPKGATGLMQLMPGTAMRLGVNNIFDTRENVFAGVRYLRWLLDRFGGDVRLALAGYNAGEHAVESYGNQVPPFLETQNYVRSIVLRYIRSRQLDSFPPRLQESGTQKSKEKFPDYNQIIQFTATIDAAHTGTDRRAQQ
jgi:soluble lytic murein transglycosylase-like protein